MKVISHCAKGRNAGMLFAVFAVKKEIPVYILDSSGQKITTAWGKDGDVPVIGDYDGEGKTDTAIWRPSTGEWWIKQSNGAVVTKVWGQNGDVPVARDYDGDGKTDYAVWRPSTGEWWVIQSSNNGVKTELWGESTDIPVNQPVGQ